MDAMPLSCTLIVPARDEEAAIGAVLAAVPAGVSRVVVVDNGSRDRTAAAARAAGAEVVTEPRPGYGWACLAGARAAPDAATYAFCDGDGSFDLGELTSLLEPLRCGLAELALGMRVAELREAGAMPPHQGVGNQLALRLLAALHGVRLADVGPFRAIDGVLLRGLRLGGSRYAWQMEMTVRALRAGARLATVPVHYRRRRGGSSKVGGRLVPSLLAGAEIMAAVVAGRLWQPPEGGLDAWRRGPGPGG
jgi:glycosyltransferase involved in cell wall biosynthesis